MECSLQNVIMEIRSWYTLAEYNGSTGLSSTLAEYNGRIQACGIHLQNIMVDTGLSNTLS